MTDKEKPAKNAAAMPRRQLLKKGLAGAVLLPLLQLDLPRAKAAARVPVTDPVAAALKYVEDAKDASRPDKMGFAGDQQLCSNCLLYTASRTETDWGSCTLFQNRLVAGPGWCTAWVPARR